VLKVYQNGTGTPEMHFKGSPIKMKGQASGDAIRFLDISINATYLNSLLVEVWDNDNGGDAPACIHSGNGRLDVVAQGLDGKPWHTTKA
jgi:hypothetical protein